MSADHHPSTIVRAYRVKGGAVVNVDREGRKRRFRVSSRRFLWLRSVFGLCACGGYFGGSSFDCRLALEASLHEAAVWLRRSGRRFA